MNINKQIKKIAIKNISAATAVIVLCVVITLLLPLSSLLKPTEIENIWAPGEDIKENTYVYATVDKLNFTGYKVTYFNSVRFGYYYAIQEDRCFFVLIPVQAKPEQELKNVTVSGKFVSIMNNRNFDIMAENLAKDLNWNQTALKTASCNYMIDSSKYQPKHIIVSLLILSLIILIQLAVIIHWVIRLFAPLFYESVPFVKNDEKKRIIENAQKEVESDLLINEEDMYLTENYLIESNCKRIRVYPLEKVVWAYRMGSAGKGIHKKEPQYSIFLNFINGKKAVLADKKSEAARLILEEMKNVDHSIMLGYSENKKKEAENRIKNNAED